MIDIDKLCDVIKKSGLTISELARKIHVSRCSLYRKLNGDTKFSVRETNAIIKELRMNRELARSIFFPDWRRFELLTDDSEEINRLESLCKSKGLSREDLAVILFTLRVRPEFQRSDFGI